mmetsp:Transcript_5859/g.8266  ORF Transcript_5859/g.8266 Transcript_5859/m.8266 type:complete len:203 (+) Transcript_5859:45-653(+)
MADYMKTVFVTVGTTQFDSLINVVSSVEFLQKIALHGFRRLVIQYGTGAPPALVTVIGHNSSSGTTTVRPTREGCDIDISWEAYRFKSSLEPDMQNADLIVSHAGAGSIMEGLSICKERNKSVTGNNCKKLVVVINDILMNNHQSELAEALDSRGYLYTLNGPLRLLDNDVMARVSKFIPLAFEGGNHKTFGRIISTFMSKE